MSGVVRRHLAWAVQGLLYFLTGWLIAVVAVNAFAPGYAIGLVFTIAAIGTVLGIGVERVAPLVWYFGVSLAGVVGAALWATAPQVHTALLAVVIIGTGFTIVVAVAARLHAEQQMQEAQRELEQSEAQLAAAQRVARLGHWVWDLGENEVVLSDEGHRLLGLEPGAVPSNLDTFLTVIHPDDRERMRSRVLAVWHGDDLSSADIEYRVIRPDGKERVMRSNSEVVRSHDGTPVQVLGTNLDVTQQKRHERELERARTQAEELLRLRTSMLNNMSHELRTPLTAILGFAETLAEEVPPAQREFAEIIVESARRLKGTVNSVLDLSQIDSGGLRLNREALDLGEETQAVVRLLRRQAEKRGLLLKVQSEAPVRALLDRRFLGRILNNLVGNAIKFTERGGVTLTIGTEASTAYVRVEDTGVGISETFLPHLFDEFRQQSSGLARTYEGNGLGLSITHRLVTLMDGQLSVESEEGVGSVFTVHFPAAVAAAEDPPPASCCCSA